METCDKCGPDRSACELHDAARADHFLPSSRAEVRDRTARVSVHASGQRQRPRSAASLRGEGKAGLGRRDGAARQPMTPPLDQPMTPPLRSRTTMTRMTPLLERNEQFAAAYSPGRSARPQRSWSSSPAATTGSTPRSPSGSISASPRSSAMPAGASPSSSATRSRLTGSSRSRWIGARCYSADPEVVRVTGSSCLRRRARSCRRRAGPPQCGALGLLLRAGARGRSLVVARAGQAGLSCPAQSRRAGRARRPRPPGLPPLQCPGEAGRPPRALPAGSFGRLHVIWRLGEEQLRVIRAGQVRTEARDRPQCCRSGRWKTALSWRGQHL
jgi:hypothetical protein